VRASVERKLRVFGPHGERMFSVGTRPELVGRPVESFDVTRGATTVAHIDGADAYDDVKLGSGFVPALISGSIEGSRTGRRELAFAVNGRIQGVAPTFNLRDDNGEQFAILVREGAFHEGRNRVEVLEVSGQGRSPALERVGEAD
jgi:hypothetical protein